MIETVYSEVNQENEYVKIPKNIHQIGDGDVKCHVYIEDKVSEFLAMLPENEKEIRYGVLLGTVKFFQGESYLFINAMVEVREVLENTILFGDDVWMGIYEDIKKYYRGQKIVGWYASLEETKERDFFQFRKIHLDHFAGNDKVFLNVNRIEKEKEFYVYGNGDLEKITCYHIYYEKNADLERYICETHYEFVSSKPKVRTKADGIKISPQPKEEVQEASDTEGQWTQRIIRFSNKAVAACVVGAFLFTFGMMYRQGQFRGITDELKDVVAGIMDKDVEMDGVTLLEDISDGVTDISQNIVSKEAIEVQESTSAAENESIQETTNVEAETENKTEVETAAVLPATTQFYTVEPGDTLYGICMDLYGNANNIDVIIELNDLTSPDNIFSGKTLVVP